MRRGLVVIGGTVGDFAGINMIAGSLFVFGACGIAPAAGMRRGTLAVFHDVDRRCYPPFAAAAAASRYSCEFICGTLKAHRLSHRRRAARMRYEVFHGDLLNGGRGEILVRG